MKYWVINNEDETYVTEFSTKEKAVEYLRSCLNNEYTSVSNFTLVEGNELKITRNISINVDVV